MNRKHMVRLAATSVAAASLIAAAGCSSGTRVGEENPTPAEGQDGTGEVTGSVRAAWWGSAPRHEVTNAVFDLFEEANDGVTVEREFADFGAHFERLNVQASSGNMPCLPQLQGRQLNDYTTRDLLLPLDPMIESGAIDVSDIPAEVLDTGRGLDGELYMIPYGAAYDALLVNESVAEEIGVGLPPEGYTWEDFFDWAAQAQAELPDGMNALNLGGSRPNFLISYVAASGESLFEGSELGFSQELLVEYWSQWEEARTEGVTITPEEDAEMPSAPDQNYVAQGRTLADTAPGNALVNAQATLDGTGDGGALTTVALPSGPAGSGNVLFTSGFGIAASCDNVPSAAAAIDFWATDDEAAAVFASNNGAVTNTSHLEEQLADSDMPELQAHSLELYGQIAANEPPTVVYPPGYQAAFEDAYGRAYESIAFGGTDVQEAAEAFFTEVNASLADAAQEE
ncbi:ABC transporter substrate-binding protein [Ruania alba]|uniref:Multiple sugar transport system substrate-binding protein n=1 Tax=Ruania alba TaxID=648782 RepID=A0A1H5MF65_9MICO|nr:ABC transporter substrate-binding protein [Ruania alba]SEE87730.1 multiple sugar transport system substrate-binding protein [Ruania alba]